MGKSWFSLESLNASTVSQRIFGIHGEICVTSNVSLWLNTLQVGILALLLHCKGVHVLKSVRELRFTLRVLTELSQDFLLELTDRTRANHFKEIL